MRKIALPVTMGNQIDSHFGHCEFYSIYTVSDSNEILKAELIKSAQGCGCKSNIAAELAEMGVTVMLAGGIGGGAINVLNQNGIEVVRGCSGSASDAVTQYLAGLISDSGESCHTHEHLHQSGHSCNH